MTTGTGRAWRTSKYGVVVQVDTVGGWMGRSLARSLLLVEKKSKEYR